MTRDAFSASQTSFDFENPKEHKFYHTMVSPKSTVFLVGFFSNGNGFPQKKFRKPKPAKLYSTNQKIKI